VDMDEVAVKEDVVVWKEDEIESANPTPYVSVSALNRDHGLQTMRVIRFFSKKKKNLYFLIDSESTYNFLDNALARKLGWRINLLVH